MNSGAREPWSDPIVDAVRQSNMAGFGATADRLDAALAALDEATGFLLAAQRDGRGDEALAGATPYLRLFALAAGGCYLAKGALAEGAEPRIALCRFFAENLVGETGALRDRVAMGADSLAAASRILAA